MKGRETSYIYRRAIHFKIKIGKNERTKETKKSEYGERSEREREKERKREREKERKRERESEVV